MTNKFNNFCDPKKEEFLDTIKKGQGAAATDPKAHVKNTQADNNTNSPRFKFILRSDGEVILIDVCLFEQLSKHCWYPGGTKNRYATTYYPDRKSKSIYMHRLIMDAPEGWEVDHINGNCLDNRRDNLRLCKRGENACNQKYHKNKTGFLGVSFDRRPDRFRATLCKNGRRYNGPRRKTAIEAALDYDDLARKHHGPFARLNFPMAGELPAIFIGGLKDGE